MLGVAGCKPEEVAYLDDQLKDSKHAPELGINLILHKTGIPFYACCVRVCVCARACAESSRHKETSLQLEQR
jgi:hypothetical protein